MKLTNIQRSELKMKFGGMCSYCGELLEDSNRKLREYVANYRLALMFGQVQETTSQIIFHFEKWEQSQ